MLSSLRRLRIDILEKKQGETQKRRIDKLIENIDRQTDWRKEGIIAKTHLTWKKNQRSWMWTKFSGNKRCCGGKKSKEKKILRNETNCGDKVVTNSSCHENESGKGKIPPFLHSLPRLQSRQCTVVPNSPFSQHSVTTSSGVSKRASEWMCSAEQSERSKRMSERCEWISKQTREWPSLNSWLFWTIVRGCEVVSGWLIAPAKGVRKRILKCCKNE